MFGVSSYRKFCSKDETHTFTTDVVAMAVHPEYGGRGIAKMLLQRALEVPGEAGQDAYLESTPAGHELYKRVGFEDLEVVPLSSIEYRTIAMMWHPKSQRKNDG